MKENWETFRFTNDQLQSSLIKAIVEAGLVHKVKEDGTILYLQEHSIEECVEKIVDTVFPDGYYRTDIADKDKAERYRRFKKFTGTKFIEEIRSGESYFVQKHFEKLYRYKGIPTHISFSLTDEDLNPDKITAYLGISPTFCCFKGEQIDHPYSLRRRDAPLPIIPFGKWDICSYPEIESNEILDHIEWLFEKIEPISSELQCLRGQLEKKGAVWISLHIVNARYYLGHLTLSKLMLNRLGKICDMLNIVFWQDDYI